MPELLLRDRLEEVRRLIAARQLAGGWSHPVKIVAVTKTHGPEAVRAVAEAGLGMVGENRIQEALSKQDACADVPIEWHLIGTLQRNKVRQAIGRFALIHSLDRIELAEEFDRRLSGQGTQAVLVQVNCSNEPQKGGVSSAELPAFLDSLRSFTHLDVRGLMTMAEFTEDESVQRRTFSMLREIRGRMQLEGHRLPELSMGMSGDFGAAVEEGATMLRLGTVLFGPRE